MLQIVMFPCLPWALQMLVASHQLRALRPHVAPPFSPGFSLPAALSRCQGDVRAWTLQRGGGMAKLAGGSAAQ